MGVEGGDGAAGPVSDPELGDGVAAAHHPIPHPKLPVLDLEALLAKAVPGGQHHDLVGRVLFGLLPGHPPVLEQGEGGGGFGVGGHDPVMGLVGGHGVVDQPASDQVEGFAFPGLVLPTVLGQLAGAEAQAEGAEAAAGLDGGELPVVAD